MLQRCWSMTGSELGCCCSRKAVPTSGRCGVSGLWFGLVWQWCEDAGCEERAQTQDSGCPSCSQICRYRVKQQKDHSCSAGGCSQLSALSVAGVCAVHCCHRCVKQMISTHRVLHGPFSNQGSIPGSVAGLFVSLDLSQTDACLLNG